jgi:hypothetical protein
MLLSGASAASGGGGGGSSTGTAVPRMGLRVDDMAWGDAQRYTKYSTSRLLPSLHLQQFQGGCVYGTGRM